MQILVIWLIRLKPKQEMQIYLFKKKYCIAIAASLKQCTKDDVIKHTVFHHNLKPVSIKEAV